MNYKHYPVRPGALTPEFVKEEYIKLTGRIAGAESSATADAWISLFEDWNALNAFGIPTGVVRLWRIWPRPALPFRATLLSVVQPARRANLVRPMPTKWLAPRRSRRR